MNKKMGKLTENIIYQKIRTCPTDLSKIKQLNVTGRGLTDISIIKELVGLETLSLSVNKISTLSYFASCKNLRALYLRQNEIADLKEIRYLMNLPRLEVLSLAQNPCAKEPQYRTTVIKNLKYLTELDDIPVGEEDRKEAALLGSRIPPSGEGSDLDSTTITLGGRSNFENTQKGPEDIGSERSSKLRIGTRNTKSCCNEIGSSGWFPEGSFSRLSPLQCRILQGSRIDLGSASSQLLSEDSSKASKLLLAILYMVKDLGYSELQTLLGEVTVMLNAMSLQYRYQ